MQEIIRVYGASWCPGAVHSGSTKPLASAVGEDAAAAIGIQMYLEALEKRPVHEMVGT